jgi:hypothetical protein
VRAVVLHDARDRERQQPAHLLGHLPEHTTRLGVLGDERRDPAQRRLLVGELALGRLGGGQRAGGPSPLGGDRGEQQRGEGGRGDEELRREQAVGDRLAHERAVLMCGVPDRDGADDEDRRGGAARPEAQRRPQEHGEDDVRDVALRRQFGEHDQQDQHDGALERLAAPDAGEAAGGPRQQHGRHDEDARGVAQRPGAEHTRELVRGDHVPEAQRRRAERRADERRHERAGDEGEHVDDALEARPAVRQPAQQQGGEHDRQRVADGLPENGAERRREVAEQQIADHDPRPQPHAVQEQDGEPEARGRPHGRDGSVEVGQLQADPAGEVVGGRHERHLQRVQAQRPVSGPAQRLDPAAGVAEAPTGRADVHGVHPCRDSRRPAAM